MAVIENNPWIEGARGMVRGAIVYRQRAGRTIVSARPSKSSKPLSEKQKAHHRRFREATAYSKRVKEDDGLFAKYAAAAEGFISWQNLAVRDYMYAPVVEKVVAEGFTGKAGEVLEVYASDDFGICSLQVRVMDGRGAVWESGECIELIANEVYAYNLKRDVDITNGLMVRVEAADAAGNVTVYEEEIVAGGNEVGPSSPASDGAPVDTDRGADERRAYGTNGYFGFMGLQRRRPDGTGGGSYGTFCMGFERRIVGPGKSGPESQTPRVGPPSVGPPECGPPKVGPPECGPSESRTSKVGPLPGGA
ncbi:hypothetical protein AB9P05_01520 [Roseivirga sp. BDSF3-8]|uniref:hypothetical protein n=1 Tax=Roseivirga sp. BDSF3-8 TaxID=3241598 RepID=UPI0035323CFC